MSIKSAISGFIINKTGIISGIGEKKELIATVFPSNATENTVEIAKENDKVEDKIKHINEKILYVIACKEYITDFFLI